jgi:Cft2 family RNA processing exonuclease
MRVTLLGGAEIDGSATLIETSESVFLVDYGMVMENGDSNSDSADSPKVHEIPPKKIDFCFLTHAHLDHSGGILELLKRYPKCTVVCSYPTWHFAQQLLADTYRRAGRKCQIGQRWLFVEPNKNYHLGAGELKVKFIPNGHCRGSSAILIETEGKRIMFSGDISDVDLPTVSGFRERDFSNINPDILFLESTYGNQKFPPREEEEERLVEEVKKVVSSGGNVLIPAFAFGRAQDIASVLVKNGLRVFIDGMAQKIISQMREEMLWGNDRFFFGYRSIKFVRQPRRKITRRKITPTFFDIIGSRGKIVVASPGWLQGGTSLRYLYYWIYGPRNAIFFTGSFQKYTAAELLENDFITVPHPEDPKREKIVLTKNAQVERFFLSSHADQDGLLKFAKLVNPSHIILYHGSKEARTALRQAAMSLHCDSEIIEEGKTINI